MQATAAAVEEDVGVNNKHPIINIYNNIIITEDIIMSVALRYANVQLIEQIGIYVLNFYILHVLIVCQKNVRKSPW